MHLHGFYFRVDARGDGTVDTAYHGNARLPAVTEMMPAGGTLRLTWVPERAGNWLFHCHIPEHFAPRGPLGEPTPAGVTHDHARGGMSGLVAGVTVREGVRFDAIRTTLPERRLRLLVRPARQTTEGLPLFTYALHDHGPEPPVADGYTAAPALDLVRGQPVRIQVVNRLAAPTAVHWHGIELESYFDGVPGFSGAARRTTPLIPPGDSFEVRFTPPRAGTFIYHTHVDEARQQAAGLAGPIIVRPDTTPRDATTDIPIVISEDPDPAMWNRRAWVNGSPTPAPIRMRVGSTYRLRFVQMTVTWAVVRAELWRDSTLQAWRIAAKDGAERPASQRISRPAWLRFGIGEAYDVEVTPDAEGEMQLQVRMGVAWPRPAPLLTVVPIQAVR
jgi:FtsP/CotA-like multicopper oxidase with cupredoxin domain